MTQENLPSIKSLVPANIESLPESASFEHLPHLQRVGGLVFLLLLAKERFRQQTASELSNVAQNQIDRLKTEGVMAKTLQDLFTHSREFLDTWLTLHDRNKKELPKIIADKIEEHGSPFGFEPNATRAILEMANDFYENQRFCDSISCGPDNDLPPPTEYFEEMTIQIFEFGRKSGLNPFSYTDFPAGNYFNQIFPPEVAREMKTLIKQRDDEIDKRIKEKLAKDS